MPFLSHAGTNLRYERAGQGQPVVFVHGWLGNHTFWDPQATALKQKLQIVRLDLRGHGDSSKPRGGYGIGALAGDVHHLVTALGLQRCVLVGWSMGGLVVQQARRLLGNRVAGLVLVGTTARATPTKGYAHGVTAEEQAQFVDGVETDYKGFVRTFAPRLFKPGRDHLVAWAIQQMLKTPPHVALAALHGILAADEREALGDIAVPTLVCHGRHDTIFPVAMGEYLHKHVKGSTLVVFEDSGHAPALEETERFNAALGAFVEKLG
jgi:non-heme chloroperoxidase